MSRYSGHGRRSAVQTLFFDPGPTTRSLPGRRKSGRVTPSLTVIHRPPRHLPVTAGLIVSMIRMRVPFGTIRPRPVLLRRDRLMGRLAIVVNDGRRRVGCMRRVRR